ncbi:ferredoxin--NADP reductase [Streptomyces purpurogeneiscleroticus]|uniref:ferredoxin--NADP reductase n=1 Tax=Streptomyces purpurogeneiscleroticus TaxID=68259 RepID=UPI001CBFD463|nr:ferredoxin--NADP reductase [Streptomyces purpurogeneiscleroticus]MBZ4018403.1 3-ketosteroid-9-alpha-hydroxylase [Streptomyces purpurogeneiscleroticus]
MSEPCTYRLRVLEVIEETAEARSLVLQVPLESAERFTYRAGQFLTVKLPGTDGGTAAARCYSLSSAPETGEPLKITVKRVAGGYGSQWICDHVAAGDELEVLPPAGTFTLDSPAPDLLLVAGGSGITPVISLAKSALVGGLGRVALLYANRDESSVVFRDELRELTEDYPDRLLVVHWLESLQGLPAADRLVAVLAPYADRETYVCGPAPLMDAVEEAMGGRPVHRERFFSLGADVFAAPGLPAAAEEGGGTVAVELDGETHTVRWPVRTPLLDALLAAGVDAPYSCREGSCGACACRIVSGETKMLRNDVLDEQDLAEGYVLACQAVPLTDEVAVSYS